MEGTPEHRVRRGHTVAKPVLEPRVLFFGFKKIFGPTAGHVGS